MQIGAGYEFNNFHIRAQYIGGYMGLFDAKRFEKMDRNTGEVSKAQPYPNVIIERPARFELAIAFTGVPDLLIDLGFKMHMPIEINDGTTDIKTFNGYYASVGAQYELSDFKITARLDAMHIGAYGNRCVYGALQPGRSSTDDKTSDPMGFQFRMCPTYDFGPLVIGSDIGFYYRTESINSAGDGKKDARTDMGFSLFALKNMPMSYVKAGVTFTPASLIDGKATGVHIIQFPISVGVSFY